MYKKPSIKDIAKSNRITRCCLIGTGIVSGLDLALDKNHHICVAAGKGISSDGKYFELSVNHIFAFYRDFVTDTKYPLFYYDDGTKIPLWELVCDKEFKDTDQSLSPQYHQERLNPFLKDKVVLIYLTKNKSDQTIENNNDHNEYLVHKIGKDKDSETYCSVHFLLMRQQDLLVKLDINRLTTQIVWNRLEDDEDYIYSDEYNPDDDKPRLSDISKALNPALRLPVIPLRRFGFGRGDPFDCPPGGPDESVFPDIKSIDDIYNGYKQIIDEAVHDLHTALRSIYHYYRGLIDKFPAWDIKATIDVLNDKWEAYKVKNSKNNKKKEYIQYFYDWIRDLLAAYHELRSLLIDYSFLSLSGVAEFQNHFLLGQPLREIITQIPRPFRQNFRQPPVFNGQADRLQAIKLYYWRILVMIKNFYLPDCIEESKLDFCNTPIEDQEETPDFEVLKITPGKFYDKPLGEQSIPYYYYPLTRHRYSLHHFWNYEHTRNSSNDQILSYHANDSDDSYTNHLHVIRPLHYNLDQYPFYRIEGFIGRPLNDIYSYRESNDETNPLTYEGYFTSGLHSQLIYFKKKYNLPFNIKIISIDEPNNLTAPYKFPDYDENNVDTNGNNVDNQGNVIPFAPMTSESYHSFEDSVIGLEHIAGVIKGGTFVLVHARKKMEIMNGIGEISEKFVRIAIADFYLPYSTEDDPQIYPVVPEPPTEAGSNLSGTRRKITPLKSQKTDKIEKTDKKIPVDKKTKSTADKVRVADEKESDLNKQLINKIGSASVQKKDKLNTISGIAEKTEKLFNDIEIYTYWQLSKITDAEYEILDKMNVGLKGKTKILKWAEEAKQALKNKS